MALVRVYCGLASADLNNTPPGSVTWLTVAVVDDSGRLLDICDISDDAAGFAELGALLAERSNGFESVAIAADSDDHIVTQLLTAAGRYLAYTDEDSAEDYAERFSNVQAAIALEGLARLDEWTAARQRHAARMDRLLEGADWGQRLGPGFELDPGELAGAALGQLRGADVLGEDVRVAMHAERIGLGGVDRVVPRAGGELDHPGQDALG